MSRRGWSLLLLLGVVWGLPYLFIKIAVETFSPQGVVFLRCVIAAAILLPIAVGSGQLKRLRGRWTWVIVFALVEITFTWLALNWAEQRISSSFAALLIATVPLVTAVLAWRVGIDDRLGGRRLVGLGVGFLGVAALVGLDISGGSAWAVAAMAITVLGYSLGPIIVDRKLSDLPSLAIIAAAMTLNAVLYAPWAWVSWPTGPIPTSAWVSVLVLGSVCSALAFIIFFALIAEVGPSRTTLITYINPVVAVALGVIVLSEPLTIGLALGLPLVLLGSWMATRKGPAIESERHA
jgi:drug/metabolite transporter (DMT)-like permease